MAKKTTDKSTGKTTRNRCASKREAKVNLEPSTRETGDLLSIDNIAGSVDMDEDLQGESLLDGCLQEQPLEMPEYKPEKTKRSRWPFINGHKKRADMARALVITESPFNVDFDARIEKDKLTANGIYPTRRNGRWIYPVLIDKKGNMMNYPRQQSITLKQSSFILYLLRSWWEHKVLTKPEDKNFWQKATSYGIIGIVVLIVIVIFLLLIALAIYN